jgi:PKD domain
MKRHTLLALAIVVPALVLVTSDHAVAGFIDFEQITGMTPMSQFLDGIPVDPDSSAGSSRLSTQLQLSDGVTFSSDADYVALIHLGNQATSGVVGIGGVTAQNILKYDSPIIITFTMPGDASIPAVTSYVSIRGDLQPGSGFAMIEAFDVNGVPLTSEPVSVPDAAGFTLQISTPTPKIHSVRISQTASAFIAFDDLSFNPLMRATNVDPIADAGPDQGVFVGDLVSLNGSLSQDPDLDPITFAWTLTTPAGSAAVLSADTTAFPTFTPDVAGTYTATLTVRDSSGATASDSVDVSAITKDQFVAGLIADALNRIGAMPREQVTTRGNQNALQNFLTQALDALRTGDMDRARDKLQKSMDRTDGCALRGTPDRDDDRRDWITDCAAQTSVYGLLTTALGALNPERRVAGHGRRVRAAAHATGRQSFDFLSDTKIDVPISKADVMPATASSRPARMTMRCSASSSLSSTRILRFPVFAV